MLRRCYAALVLAVVGLTSACDNAPTVVHTLNSGIPQGWAGFPASSPQVGITTEFAHGGTQALSIAGRVSANINQSVLATNYRGQRVRWSGWLKGTAIANGFTSGLWMRVDDGQQTLAFDNMFDRPFIGTNDWTFVSVVLDVPQSAIGISMGVIFNASGRLIVDDLALQVVGADVATTKAISPFAFNTTATYTNAPAQPLNLGFEATSGRD